MLCAPHRLFVAVDTDNLAHAETIARKVNEAGASIKLGLEFFLRFGADGVRCMREAAPDAALFLDLKLHDIPNTVAAAMRAVAAMGVQYTTVHAAGGEAMLKASVNAASERVRVLAVTLLTSLDETDVMALGFNETPAAAVARLADLAARAGCYGAVCSAHETAMLKAQFGDSLRLVTPGIRGRDAASQDDQRRTATAAEALAYGADYLVVGRPITQAADTVLAIKTLLC